MEIEKVRTHTAGAIGKTLCKVILIEQTTRAERRRERLERILNIVTIINAHGGRSYLELT